MSSQLHPMLNVAIKAARTAGSIINRAALDVESCLLYTSGNLVFMAGSAADQPAQGLADRIVLLRDTIGGERRGLCRIGAGTRFGRDDAGRYTHRRGTSGHGFDDHGVAANLGPVAHGEPAQHLSLIHI